MFRYVLLLFSLFVFEPERLLAEKNSQKNVAAHPSLIQCPKGWEIIEDRSQLPKKIAVMFVGSKKGSLAPSINLATESSTLSIEEYLKQAEQYHKEIAGTLVTKLGKIATKSGELQLLQIDRTTTWGQIRFIQAATIQENTAYVITATCLTDDFPHLAKTIFSTLQSFSLPELKDKKTLTNNGT